MGNIKLYNVYQTQCTVLSVKTKSSTYHLFIKI